MDKTEDLQAIFLSALIETKASVFVYLINGIKLQGQLVSYDQHSLVLDGATSQLLYKHSISTIMPAVEFGF